LRQALTIAAPQPPSLAPPLQPNATSTRRHGKKYVSKIAHASAAAVQPGRTPAERLSANSGHFVTFFAVRNASALRRNLRDAFYGAPAPRFDSQSTQGKIASIPRLSFHARAEFNRKKELHPEGRCRDA
jgi:hypothetical protein